jgi:tRNA threonylcarbamoyladenosine biosynthesis protein TsaE
MRSELRARTAEETRAVGAAIAPLLRPGDVVALGGELGAGKTTLVQGAAAALGVRQRVLSPTFTLVKEYEGWIPIHHLDVYRLRRIQDVLDLGFEEMIDSGAVVFIEWGDAIEALLPEDHLDVDLVAIEDSEERRIAVEAIGPAWAERLERLEAALEPWEEDAP